MCGIYGTTLPYAREEVRQKLERTAFRGPDRQGIETYRDDDRHITFGHNRLSIIDLDSRSDQPFTYNEFIHIVFNGEIYNFKELKTGLLKKGYAFRTTSDTEVICAAYLEYGERCVEHFIGMFAFVIFDSRNHSFFGARDRLGQKPFYYYHNGQAFEFASQISSIQLFNTNLTISSEAICYYLAWNTVPDPKSIFNEIKKLKAGHRFSFNLETGRFRSESYWDIDFTGKYRFEGNYLDAKEQLTTVLEDAVSKRLFADVPVGVFLSGGIDSSLVAAMATHHSTSQVNTFSVKFLEAGFDESIYAQQVANHLNTNHHVIECNYAEGLDLIENFSYYYDEPFADSSAIPSMLLSKYTRKEVKVALSGDGGDESFIGYHRYNWIRKGKKLYYLPYFMRSLGGSLLRLSPNYRLKTLANTLTYHTIDHVYLASMNTMDRSYFATDIDFNQVDELKYLFHTKKNQLERVSDFDLKTYLNWDINTKVDRASMAFSLEARAPLLDHRVVDFARSLPTEFKFHKGIQKRILKDVLYESVPKTIFDRPKSGFTMPFSEWFRNDLKEFVLSELDDEGLQSIPCIDVERIKFMIDQHMTGKWNRFAIIWNLIVLKQWLTKNGKGYQIK